MLLIPEKHSQLYIFVPINKPMLIWKSWYFSIVLFYFSGWIFHGYLHLLHQHLILIVSLSSWGSDRRGRLWLVPDTHSTQCYTIPPVGWWPYRRVGLCHLFSARPCPMRCGLVTTQSLSRSVPSPGCRAGSSNRILGRINWFLNLV